MSYHVTIVDGTAHPTLVVPAATSWPEFPALWPTLSSQVWVLLREAGVRSGCPNVMLYLDDAPHVEVGVLLSPEASRLVPPLDGPVVRSALPAGRVATTEHRGPYPGLGAAHRAVLDWCAATGHRAAGPRWEVYGPHRPDPAELRTEVFHLLG